MNKNRILKYFLLIGIFLIYVSFLPPTSLRITQKEFSWGMGIMKINNSLAFDFGGEYPVFEIYGFGPSRIVETEWEAEDSLKMIFFFDRGPANIEYVFHFLDDDTFWIENRSSSVTELSTHPNFSAIVTDPHNLYYRNSRP